MASIMIWPFKKSYNPIQDGLFRICSWMEAGGALRLPRFPENCHTYLTMTKLATVIPYSKKIQKIYQSRGTRLEFC